MAKGRHERVFVNGRGGTWTVTGVLSTATHYWKVNHFEGRALKETGTGEVDDNVNFSGEFFEVRDGDTLTINTTVGTTATSCTILTLPRMA